MTTASARTTRPPLSAPADVLRAVAGKTAWKNWLLLGQLLIIALLILVCSELARRSREPDVVLVSPDGRGTYVERSVVGDAILDAIHRQRGQPSDITIATWSKDTLEMLLAVNSTTIDEVWPKALERMDPALRAKLSKEYAEQRVLETWRLAGVKTTLRYENVELVERTDRLLHVRATAIRTRASLVTASPAKEERIQVDLVAAVVPRSWSAPDGLLVRDFSVQALQDTPAPLPTPTGDTVSHGTTAQ